MADKSLIALTEATSLVGSDEILVSAGGQAGNPRRATFDTVAKMIASGVIALAAGVLTASSPMTVSQTWNNAGVTFVGRSLDITNTASAAASLIDRWRVGGSNVLAISLGGQLQGADGAVGAPTYSFASDPDTGLYSSGANVISVTTSGTARGRFTSAQFQLAATYTLGWSSGSVGSTTDLVLTRDAANVLAQVNGTTAQTHRIYNTSANSNVDYERGFVQWSSNVLQIGTEAGGTGTNRAMSLITSGSTRWTVQSTGHLITGTDNAYDIGASGATRPRTLYLGTSVINGAGGLYTWSGRSVMQSGADGNIMLSNNAANAFGLLQLGGTTNSFPALKRNGNVLEARRADDSAFATMTAVAFYINQQAVIDAAANDVIRFRDNGFANSARLVLGDNTTSWPALRATGPLLDTILGDASAFAQHRASIFTVVDGVTAPGATSGFAKIYVDTADGDLKVVFGDGTVKVLAADT